MRAIDAIPDHQTRYGATWHVAGRNALRAGGGSVVRTPQRQRKATYLSVLDGRNPGEVVEKKAGLRRLTNEPVAEIVQCDEPAPKALRINNLQDQPNRSIELPQRKSLIESPSR